MMILQTQTKPSPMSRGGCNRRRRMLWGGFRRRRAPGAMDLDAVVLVAVMAVLSLMVAACGGGEADDSAADDGEAGSSDSSNGSERLSDYLGIPGFNADPDQQQAFYMQQEQQAQESIAACMASEGFEYIPAVRPLQSGFAFGGADDEEEFAREQGFGITTSISAFGDADVDTVGQSTDDDNWTDPNEEIVAALSESERQAYNGAFYGADMTSFGDSDADGEEDGSSSSAFGDFGDGCMPQAYEEIYSSLAVVFEELDLESMYEEMTTGPESQAVFGEWSQCMSAQGHEYESPEDMYDDVFDDFQSRLEEIGAHHDDPFSGMSPEEVEQMMADKSPEERVDLFEQAEAEARAEIDQEALQELQDEERGIALANFECSEEIRMDERLDEISARYEARFIADNRVALEGIKNKSEE